MKIANGIKGIRQILMTNGHGWHVFIRESANGEYVYIDFSTMSVEALRVFYADYTLTAFSGNGIYFSK